MSGFSPEWLALREPADLKARDAGLLQRLSAAVSEREGLTLVDLGTGTGSTLRALAPWLPGPQRWRLVDHDEALLARAVASAATLADAGGGRIEAVPMLQDLSRPGWEPALEGADIVTASALLDLVGEDFLASLADRAREAGAIVYVALTVDGRLACTPSDPLDEAVFAAFRHHMRTDKGLGPALGPEAVDAAAQMLAAHGFDVALAPSDWRIGPGERALAEQLLAGWVSAVGETGLVPEIDLAAWRRRRLREIDDGLLELRVGHRDLLALPR